MGDQVLEQFGEKAEQISQDPREEVEKEIDELFGQMRDVVLLEKWIVSNDRTVEGLSKTPIKLLNEEEMMDLIKSLPLQKATDIRGMQVEHLLHAPKMIL